MGCSRCKSVRLVEVNAKCNDLCCVTIQSRSHDGYVPKDIGIGGGDYIDLSYCLECGQIQGQFPLSQTELEADSEEE